ncbi:protease inhibitor I42 family protein [Streptomyces sp. NPDC101150]|uniref:protease inhibitor I42 family protein n=1 Tax=Streptomyces sp. NPDC101150 TaxID=3366114 RepID=UPI00381F60F1
MIHRTRKAALTAAALLCALQLAVGCGAAPQPKHHPAASPTPPHRWTVFPGKQKSITVRAREDFSIAVRHNPTTGEERKVVTPKPDPKIVRARGTYYKADHQEPDWEGGGGVLHFRFHAQGPGTTKIVLYHCLRNACSGSRTTLPPHFPKPERTTYTVTVK